LTFHHDVIEYANIYDIVPLGAGWRGPRCRIVSALLTF
jgi:hypothetical protein